MSMSSQLPELDFQHLLAHTFPGFFSSITLFMLLDYWSPYSLTSKIMSIEGLVGFAGFILIIGTILGVILDGIHHIVLEDGIFSCLDEIRVMYKSVEHFFPCINLKPRYCECSSLDSLLTPHNLLTYFYNSKDEILSIDRELTFRYYRYSEFFANTFLSLTVFSIVSPLYLFKEVDIPWRISVLLGLISLGISMLCFEASHLAYVRYLKAQISFLAGFKNDNANVYYSDKPLSLFYNFLKNFDRYNFFVTIIYALLFIIFSQWLMLGFTSIFYLIFIILILIFSSIFRSQPKLSTKSAKGQLFQEITFSYLGMLFFILIIIAFYPMPHIDPNPMIFEGDYHMPKNANDTNFTIGSIFIINKGDDVENLTAESSYKWIDVCWETKCSNTCEKNICLPEDGNADLILRYSNGGPYAGGHIGQLKISGKTKMISLLNFELIEPRIHNITIQIRLNISY